MVIVDQQRAHQRFCMSSFSKYDVNQASASSCYFELSFLSSSEMELIGELQLSLMNTGFVFEENNTDHIVISGIPVNVTESEVSLVLEQLLICRTEFQRVALVKNTIHKSMAKSLAVKQNTLNRKEQENLVNGLCL
jgi:DNA mismatch repair protein MutL